MHNREQYITALRPTIDFDDKTQTSDHELFQNNNLRPILKFQNEIILSYFKYHIAKRASHLKTLPEEQLLLAIKSELTNNLPLRNTLIGAIIGLFTGNELKYYLCNERQIKKRLISMLLERIFSQKKQLLH